ncbi:hypothetical protein C8R47DRAFT_1230387 [Mycena vitilis]|nr:hypothetical protein C8R47DRAFT_1230387 [Mycena vitilis]
MAFPNFSSSTTAESPEAYFSPSADYWDVAKWNWLRGCARYRQHANLVIIMGYSVERLKISQDAIKKDLPSANIRRLQLDLSSLAAVRFAAAEVNAYPEPLQVLINNAAAVGGKVYVPSRWRLCLSSTT